MKNLKKLFMCALPLLAAVAVSSCKPEDEKIPVTKVEWAADIKAGKTVDTDQAPFSVADKVTVTPDNATDREVVFDSSNKDVATIDAAGVITILRAGESNIQATAGGKTDLFLLTVVAAPIDVATVAWAAELDNKEVEEGSEPFDVSGMVTVTPVDATNPALVFASSDETIATISPEGVITVAGQGSTVISATAHNGQKDEFTLTVIERASVDVASVAWAAELENGASLAIGGTLDVSAKVTVSPDNATDPSLTYNSSDEAIATISAAGLIEAIAPGTTTIKATAGSKEDTFTLTVTRIVAFDEYLTPAAIIVPVGATNRIWGHVNVTPVPADLKAKDLTFSSDNESVATVDEYGVVIGKAAGNAQITVAATENANVKAVLDVKVVAATYYARNTNEGAATPWTMSYSSNVARSGTNADNGFPAALDGIWGTTGGNEDKNTLSFSFSSNHGDISATKPAEFVVDMKTPQVVNVFKIIHRSNPDVNNLVRFFGFDEIAGSNDGENFTPIVTMIEVEDAMSPLFVAISETTFTNNVAYQYIRFTAKTKEFCVTHGLRSDVENTNILNNDESKYTYPGVRQRLNADRTPDGGTVRMPNDYRGGSLQLQELYLGKY